VEDAVRTLLIANRGEIACRVIRTARRLGLHTVAVYSDADASAAHVRAADAAVRLGPPPPRESYLNVDALLAAARATGADAVHPGYGFLSENAAFAQRCADAGLAFVGPPASAIAAMGSKSAAKEAMRRAGVPVLPGYHGAAQDLDSLEREARRLPLPLIVKPSGGGGGKGMQIVSRAEEIRPALESARRLASGAFGDATLLLERYLPAPRHVEVQVLADTHGNVVHLHDRDCSVQRRHQKLLEEAPAPRIPDDVRVRLHAAAITVARSIGYVSAGTVEFLYADGEFYFMEMNTRLQVEHPVTELVTGFDLVEWQLRIAAGEPLGFAQSDVRVRGHAVEARVCAEDPEESFAPCSGRLARLHWPERAGVRVDAGFQSGDVVPPHYDSLLGKVIAHADSRARAVDRLAAALDETRVVGIRTNVEWLARAVRTPRFRDADVDTRFVALEAGSLRAARDVPLLARAAAAVATVEAATRAVPVHASPWERSDAFRAGMRGVQTVTLAYGGAMHAMRVERHAAAWRVTDRGDSVELEWAWRDETRASLTHAGLLRVVHVEFDRGDAHLWLDGRHYVFAEPDLRRADARGGAHEGELVAKLPGTVVSVAVRAGDEVAAGAVLMVVEAMKMEHGIVAPRAGRIASVKFAAGERVTEGAVLVEFEPEPPPAG
jgi:3-methylcrotonyl-CoA carboxylase alpha subunit